jgi:hypothetical protein
LKGKHERMGRQKPRHPSSSMIWKQACVSIAR